MRTIAPGAAKRFIRTCEFIPIPVVALLIRLAAASVFWNSVQTKITGWKFLGYQWKFWGLTDTTFLLFNNEYPLPLLPPTLAAYAATCAEFFLSLGLVLGLFTRLAALGLLLMTAVIQIFVYPESWSVHILWAGLLLYLIRYGAGKWSLDHMLRARAGLGP
jgi:putative oxidoreductase